MGAPAIDNSNLVSIDPSTLVSEDPNFTDDPTFDQRAAEQKFLEIQDSFVHQSPSEIQAKRLLTENSNPKKMSYGDYSTDFNIPIQTELLPVLGLFLLFGCESDKSNGEENECVSSQQRAGNLDPQLKAAVETFLNDPQNGLMFSQLIQGGNLPGDVNRNGLQDSGEDIDFEAVFLAENHVTDFFDAPIEKQKQWIAQNLKGSMAQKLLALTYYRTFKSLADEADIKDLENTFFKSNCNPTNPSQSSWDSACDPCGQVISEAIVPYHLYQSVFKHAFGNQLEKGIPGMLEWPDSCGDNLDCDDKVEGKWKVGKVEIDAEGYLNADICILGDGNWADTCQTPGNPCDDAPGSGGHTPAFWQSAALHNLAQNDFSVAPIIWNAGKIKINLARAFQVTKTASKNGTPTYQITLHRDAFKNISPNSFRIKPYLECAQFFRENYGNLPMPFGCETSGGTFPFLIDRSASLGRSYYEIPGDRGNNPGFLELLRDQLTKSIPDRLACPVDTQEAACSTDDPAAFRAINTERAQNNLPPLTVEEFRAQYCAGK